MKYNSYDELLPLVMRPGRYLGNEINCVYKHLSNKDLHMALAFPDLYEIGTSHLGISILYHILNSHHRIFAERVFAPDKDMEMLLREGDMALASLETKTPLKDFGIIGFSLLYELNYTNVLLMLDLAKIPFLARERNETHPLVIAGGPCTCNPEPVAEFFDAMVVGDGEKTALDMCNAYLQWKDDGAEERERLLTRWSEIQGVYVPSFYEGDAAVERMPGVTRAIVENLDETAFPKAPVIAWSKPVHDRLRLEVSRGCSRGCRFCQAGMIYRPVRERSPDTLLSLSEASFKQTGYEDISLLSLSTGDYSCIGYLVERLMGQNSEHPMALSLPSVRAETLTPELMELIRQVRKTGFTIAPEAGSQRLRNMINKNLDEADIVNAVTRALQMGWQGIKLYFMIGLPGETREDLSAIVGLVKKLRTIKTENQRPYQISVSVATFIPKPHTPFQWVPQMTLEASREKIAWLKGALRMSRVQFKWQNPETSLLEGLFARGDRRLSGLLIRAYELGCRFDGWSDAFNFDAWQTAMAETGIDADEYTTRDRQTEASLPWDHIHIGVEKAFLVKEWEKALAGTSTGDCRWGECHGCGVCDFERISPRVYAEKELSAGLPEPRADSGPPEHVFLKLTYAKENRARFLGHLELNTMVIRAFRRAGISVKYSEGFHPKPKISFEDPLPLGMEGLNESLVAAVGNNLSHGEILKRLNARMPDGVTFKKIEVFTGKKASKKPASMTYGITLANGAFDAAALENFECAEAFPVYRKNKKGREVQTDLKKQVVQAVLKTPGFLEITISMEEGKTVRPSDFLKAVFGMDENRLKTVRVVKY